MSELPIMAASTVSGYLDIEGAQSKRGETEDELSRTLVRVLKISAGVLVLSGAAAPFSMEKYVPTLCLHVLFALVLAASYLYVRAGKRRSAGAVLASGFWTVATVAVFAFGGVHSPGVFVYLPVVAVGGLFWSRRAATVLAVASAVSVLFAAQLQALGALPEPLAPVPPQRLWTVFCGSLLITAVLFLSALRRLATLARDLAQSRTLLEDLAIAQEQAERERTELEQRLRSAERFESVAQVAGGAAHDFNNLLAVIMNASFALRREVPSGSRGSEMLGEIDAATARAIALVRKMLAGTTEQQRAAKHVDLNGVVSGLSSMLERLGRSDIELVVNARAERATVLADPAELEQVVLNLAVNARDAMPRGGRLRIETSTLPGSGGGAGTVLLSVSDEGVGMDATTASRIFDPFFTTKSSEGGTGLGLASVKRIVDQTGGTIRVETAPGRGTRFDVLLPRATDGSSLTSDGETRPE